MKYQLVFICLYIFGLACKTEGQYSQTVLPNSEYISYMGRMQQSDSAVTIYWSGSEVKLTFYGQGIQAMLQDKKGENYFYVLVDGKPTKKIHPTANKANYTLAERLPVGKHTVALYKLTEGSMGATTFYGFSVSEQSKLFKPVAKTRKLQFYGNSITSGYSIDGKYDMGNPEDFNHYYTYGSLTARNLNASFHCVSKSGIGLMVSWFPIIMPEMYDRIDPDYATRKWDFTQYQPDVVVVDIGQNDAWLIRMKDNPQFAARFGKKAPDSAAIVAAYQSFLKSLRLAHPQARVICALGCMNTTMKGSPWPGYVTAAVANLHDNMVSTHFFPYNKKQKHPDRKDNTDMAASLTATIKRLMKW